MYAKRQKTERHTDTPITIHRPRTLSEVKSGYETRETCSVIPADQRVDQLAG